jgi:hypothetical protein
MRYELTDHEWAAAPEQATQYPTGERPPSPKWHLLGLAIWRTVARSAAGVRPLHHLLQSLRSLASGWRVEPDHGRTGMMLPSK